MIKIVKKKSKKKKRTPYYILKYNYMIGDANGYTNEKVIISENNPFLERYVTLLRSLKPTTGRWGIVFDEYRLFNHYKEGQITKDDYAFLIKMMFENVDINEDEDEEQFDEFIVNPEDEEYSFEFYDGIKGDTEYSFLVFEGVDLHYVDEYGEKHKTIIE